MLHICYILPIFRIKKAPIGAVACPQWGIGVYTGTILTVNLPISTARIFYASSFDMVGANEEKATLTTNVQFSSKTTTTLKFVSHEDLQTVEYFVICTASS